LHTSHPCDWLYQDETFFHLVANLEVRVGSINPNIHYQKNPAATHNLLETIAEIIIEEMKPKNVKLKLTGGEGGWKGDVKNMLLDMRQNQNIRMETQT
jgi:hypothetical protein